MNLKKKLKEIESRIEKTNDKVFIIIATRELKDIKKDIEDYYNEDYKERKLDQAREFEDILREFKEFEDSYFDDDIVNIKKYKTEQLRNDLIPTAYEFSLLEEDYESKKEENKLKEEEVNPGKNSLNYTGYVFQAKYNCSSCSNFVFINKIQDYVICPHCNHKKTLNISWWKKNLFGKDFLREARELEENAASTSVTFGGENLSVAYGNGYPRCRYCKDDLKEDEYWTVSELKAATQKGYINCKKCNKSFSIRKTDKFTSSLFSYPVIAIFNEELEKENTSSKSEPIAIHCTGCGASLKVPDNKRSSTCEYCQTENILPDKLFKPNTPIQYTFNVLLKQTHKNTEEEIDKEYLQLFKILTNREIAEEKRLELVELSEKKENTFVYTIMASVLFIPVIIALFISYQTKIIGYKVYIPIENTSYTIVQEYFFNKDWAVLNSEDKEIITSHYKIEYIIGNLFKFKDYRGYNIINDKNEFLYRGNKEIEVIKKCDTCDFFGDGFILISDLNSNTTIINSKGEKIKRYYGKITYNFENGNLIINTERDNGVLVLDKHGNIIWD